MDCVVKERFKESIVAQSRIKVYLLIPSLARSQLYFRIDPNSTYLHQRSPNSFGLHSSCSRQETEGFVDFG